MKWGFNEYEKWMQIGMRSNELEKNEIHKNIIDSRKI